MELTDLYPKGTPLAEVHPDFRGMKLKDWQWAKHRERGARQIDPDKSLNAKRIWTPRDSYGLKGI